MRGKKAASRKSAAWIIIAISTVITVFAALTAIGFILEP